MTSNGIYKLCKILVKIIITFSIKWEVIIINFPIVTKHSQRTKNMKIKNKLESSHILMNILTIKLLFKNILIKNVPYKIHEK